MAASRDHAWDVDPRASWTLSLGLQCRQEPYLRLDVESFHRRWGSACVCLWRNCGTERGKDFGRLV